LEGWQLWLVDSPIAK